MHARHLLAFLLVSAVADAQSVQQHDSALALEKLFAVNTGGAVAGSLVAVRGGPPWRVRTLATTDNGERLRRFGNQLFVVNDTSGVVRRVPASGAGQPQDYNFGGKSHPQDIHVPLPGAQVAPLAYLTRRNNPNLHRFNLVTGLGVDVVDLSPVGGGLPIALGTMERDGSLLFVQVRVFGAGEAVEDEDTGVLAVVDLLTHTLVDVEPLTPGIQGVTLLGAPPRLKMQILGDTLFVSTTDGILDSRGGIEMVDLESLTSIGFALSEQQTADMGGFVMTAPDEGFFVFHTDLLASTHLQHFTIQNGPDPGPEMIVLLHDTVDVLAYDPVARRVFLPSGLSSNTPGIYVFDADSQLPVGPGPIATGAMPRDVIVAPAP